MPTHRYFELDEAGAFFRVIVVKRNLPAVLAAELAGRGRRREEVALGTATDPYQPVEGRYRLTRRCLELFARYRTPVSLVTKGTMVLRDLDVLQELGQRAGVTVCFSVPTVDVDIWRRTELGTPPPWQRLRALERLVAAGIHAGVLMAPLLPGLSASAEQIERTVRAAAEHGARFIGSGLLHLEQGIRDEFLGFVRREYPELLEGYLRLYGAKYAPRGYQERVERRVQAARAAVGSPADDHRRVTSPPAPEQLALPLTG